MAYPMVPMPTLREFIRKVAPHGVTLEKTTSTTVGPRGEVYFRYLARGTGSFAILPDVADDDVLTPTVVMSLCSQLGLSCGDLFGFTLPLE